MMCINTHENTEFKSFAEAGIAASDELDAALSFDRPQRPFRQIRVGMRHCYDAFPSGMPKLVVAALHADFTPAGGSNSLNYFSALHAHQIHTPITRSDYKVRIKYTRSKHSGYVASGSESDLSQTDRFCRFFNNLGW